MAHPLPRHPGKSSVGPIGSLRVRYELGTLRYLLLFAVTAALTALFYSILLPFQYTQAFSFANWQYLNGELLAFSLAFGLLLGLTLTFQVYAMRQLVVRRSSGLSVGALIASMLPSMLCCTPVIPTILAMVGLSTVGIYGTSGVIQSFFAHQETLFLLASLVLLVLSALWSLRLVRQSRCLVGGECC